MSCRAVRDWLHRDVESLDETQRLVLDDHLSACESCRGDRERLLLVREIGTSLAVPPAGAREYNRAIAKALLEGKRTQEKPRMRWFIPVVAFAGLAAAGIGVFVFTTRTDERTGERTAVANVPAPTLPLPAPAPTPSPTPEQGSGSLTPTSLEAEGDRVVEGEIYRGTTQLGRGTPMPDGVSLKAKTSTTIRVVGQQVVLAASSQVRWVASSKRLVVERGSIELDARTPSKLKIDVKRGEARIVEDGKLVTRVEPGTTWNDSHADSKSPKASAAELLAEARAQFVAKDYPTAEITAHRALDARPTHGQSAEIRMLLADIAQGAGKLDLSVERYTAVANDFAGTAAAESALYAAARLELRRHDTTAARTLLTRYLDRHPTGRYADDARRELGGLQ